MVLGGHGVFFLLWNLLWALVMLLHYCVLAIRRPYLRPRLLLGEINDVVRELPYTTLYGYTQEQHHAVTSASDMTITKKDCTSLTPDTGRLQLRQPNTATAPPIPPTPRSPA